MTAKVYVIKVMGRWKSKVVRCKRNMDITEVLRTNFANMRTLNSLPSWKKLLTGNVARKMFACRKKYILGHPAETYP